MVLREQDQDKRPCMRVSVALNLFPNVKEEYVWACLFASPDVGPGGKEEDLEVITATHYKWNGIIRCH